MRRLGAVLLLLVGSCSSGTFALVTVEAAGGSTAPSGLKSIDLQLTLGARTASTTLSEKSGDDIPLPATKSLQIRSGSGALGIVAIARDGAGNELGRGSASVNLSNGSTSKVTVDIDFGVLANNDASTDGSVPDLVQLTPAMLVLDHQPTLDFGTVVTGTPSGAATLTVTNAGGSPSGALGAATLSGANASAYSIMTDNCVGTILQANGSCTVLVVLSSSSAGTPTATLTVSATPGGSTSVGLTGTVVVPGAITVSPSPATFGSVLANSGTSTLLLNITNTGGTDSGPISFTISGSDAGDFSIVSGGTCTTNQTLPGGGSCSLNVQFAPVTAGNKLAALTVNATPGGPGVGSLTGTSLSPAMLSFSQATYTPSPNNPVAASSNVTITLTLQNNGTQASGNLPATIQTATHTDFTYLAGGTCVPGMPLAGGASCTIQVKFAPSTFGAKTDSLSLTVSPGAMSGVSANLSATGQQTFMLSTTINGATGTDELSSTTPLNDIQCGNGLSNCTKSYTVTTGPAPTVTMGVTTGGNSRFVNYSQDCSGASCSVTMNANHNVTANWQATFSASVVFAGSGSATITSTSSPTQTTQFNCTSNCSVTFDTNMTVTLSASSPTSIATWSGGNGCSGTGTCTLDSTHTSATATLSAGNSTVVNIAGVSGAAGTVSGQGLSNCAGPTCTTTAYSGSGTFVITATATSGIVQSITGPDCSESPPGATCTLSKSSAHTVTATFRQATNYAFVTSSTYALPFGANEAASINYVDTQCQASAKGVGLGPNYSSFKAFIYGSTTDPASASRLGSNQGWLRTDGKPFANTMTELMNSNIMYYPLRIDEHISDTIGATEYVITGAGGLTCTNYTINSGPSGEWGDPTAGPGNWLITDGTTCNMGGSHLYCMEAAYSTTVRPPVFDHTTMRYAWLSTTQYTPKTSGSIADADSICQGEATAHSLPGPATNYVALLSTTGATAISRVSTSGHPWARPDGTLIVNAASDLSTGNTLIAPINEQLGGTYTNGGQAVYTGASQPNAKSATAGNSCNDWSATSSTTGYIGIASGTRFWFFGNSASWACNSAAYVYCLEK